MDITGLNELFEAWGVPRAVANLLLWVGILIPGTMFALAAYWSLFQRFLAVASVVRHTIDREGDSRKLKQRKSGVNTLWSTVRTLHYWQQRSPISFIISSIVTLMDLVGPELLCAYGSSACHSCRGRFVGNNNQ